MLLRLNGNLAKSDAMTVRCFGSNSIGTKACQSTFSPFQGSFSWVRTPNRRTRATSTTTANFITAPGLKRAFRESFVCFRPRMNHCDGARERTNKRRGARKNEPLLMSLLLIFTSSFASRSCMPDIYETELEVIAKSSLCQNKKYTSHADERSES